MQVLEVKPMPQANGILARRGGWLDADHVRAPIGQVPHASGTRASNRQIQDTDPGEWQRGAR
jgi:hypothetical protein